jgi:WD40 repeat protein
MLFALERNNLDGGRALQGGPFKSFTLDSEGRIVTIGNNGEIALHQILGNGQIVKTDYDNDLAAHAPMERAVFITPTLIAYSSKDRTSYVIDTYAKVHPKLTAHNDYIRAASLSPMQDKFVVAYTEGIVEMMYMGSLNKPEATHDFKTKITDIYFHNEGAVYVLCHNGSLIKWNYENDNVKTIYNAESDENAFKMTAIPDKNLLAICNSEGDIQFVNLTDDSKGNKMAGAHSKLEILLYDPKTGILALSSADKRISLINTNNFNEKPLAIEEHSLGNSKVKALGFNNKGVLFAMTEDNKIHLWDTNPVTYAQTLYAMQLPELTHNEWNLILGRDFSEK